MASFITALRYLRGAVVVAVISSYGVNDDRTSFRSYDKTEGFLNRW
jgi:hypothetical protein